MNEQQDIRPSGRYSVAASKEHYRQPAVALMAVCFFSYCFLLLLLLWLSS